MAKYSIELAATKIRSGYQQKVILVILMIPHLKIQTV
jgi:hypothetical protein